MWLIAILPLLAIAQVVAGSLHDITGLGVSIPDRSAANNTAAVPSVYAFAIWGLIFLWCFAFVAYQAIPKQRVNRLLAELRGPAALAFAMNAVWEIHAQVLGLAWTSFGLIVALLMPLLATLERVRQFEGRIGRSELWLAVVPLHILAGWISVATFASLSTTLDVTGPLFGLSPILRDVFLVLLAGSVGAFVASRARVPLPYALTVVWGLLAVIVKNVGAEGSTPVAIAAAGCIALVALAAARQRPLSPPHHKGLGDGSGRLMSIP